MKSAFFLAAIAAPLIVLAESREVVRAIPGPSLLARSGIDTSTIAKECQSQCTSIINTLEACNSNAQCECTQANFGDLGTCLNCLQAVAPKVAPTSIEEDDGPAENYIEAFGEACIQFGFELNDISITATPTGIASTGDPFSIFELATPTPGATEAVTFQAPPLLPTTLAASKGKIGGADRLSALRSLSAAAFGAVAAVAIVMGGLPL